MRNKGLIRALVVGLLALGVSACGGGSDSGFSGGGGTGPDPDNETPIVTAAALTVLLPGGSTLPADADQVSEGLPIVVIARNSTGVVVQGVTVEFAVTSGELAIGNAVTDATGRATATLTTASNTALRDITILVSGGGVQSSAAVSVVAPVVNVAPTPRLGTLVGSTFTAGAIQVIQSPLAAGGSSGLSITVVDTSNGNAVFTDPVTATFTSECIRQNLASINPNPATSVNGAITATYVAQGCNGNDVITASALINGASQSAQGTIQVQPATVGSIEFVSATPVNIGIRGVGRQETSAVVFRVRDSSGDPVPNQIVAFSLNTNVGDIRLTPATGTTDATGVVRTVVTSGTVATPVRVTASTTQNGVQITSQSEQLTITTGIPDQNSFSLSAECFNVEALQVDNVIVPIQLLAADRYNNPVPDGTAVNFTTEGGAIVGNCETLGGGCVVNWNSQNPRPNSYNGCDLGSAENTDENCSVVGSRGAARAGRSTVMAFAIGEESFDDADGDGLYDLVGLGETVDENGNGVLDPGERYGDISEAFVDWNGNNERDNGTSSPGGPSDPAVPVEPFFDFAPLGDTTGSFGVFDEADGKFNGLLCDNRTTGSQGRPPLADDILCPLPRTRHVSDSLVIVMSGSSPVIDIGDIGVSPDDAFDAGSGTITIDSDQAFVLNVVLRDLNDQPLASGTTVAFTAIGDAGDIQGTSSYTIPCTTDDTRGANSYGVAFQGAELDVGDDDETGSIELRVTSPGGVISLIRFTVITRAPT